MIYTAGFAGRFRPATNSPTIEVPLRSKQPEDAARGGPSARAVLHTRSPRAGWRHVAVALLTAAALCMVFGSRVTSSFESFRLKAVTTSVSSADGTVTVNVPAFANAGVHSPFAVIARIQNLSRQPLRFSIAVDGASICEADVQPGQHRVDCAAARWDGAVGHAVRVNAVRQTGDPWALAYLEVATHHGATRNYDLVVVPASRAGVEWAWPWIAGLFVLCGLTALVPRPRMTRRVARAHTALRLVLLAFLAVVWLSPVVSPYEVLLSPRLFLALAAAGYLPWIWAGARWLIHGEARAAVRRAALVAIAAIVVLAVYGTVVERMRSSGFHGNYSGFLRISETMYDRDPMLNQRKDVRDTLFLDPGGGYDGQFMYFAAFDPLITRYRSAPATYRLYIDAPPYRFGRIGFIWLTVLFSGGQWPLFPAVMMWLLLAALGGAAVALGLVESGTGPQTVLGGLVILVPGFWQSVQLGLPEPVAAALLVAGFLAVLRGRPRWAGVMFAVSLLVRETGAILVVALVAQMWWRRQRQDAAWLAALAFAPYVAWRLYVGWVLGPDAGMQAYWLKNVGMPLGGLADLWGHVRRGAYYPADLAVARAAVYFSALLIAAFGIAAFAAIRLRTVPAIAAVVYGTLALSLTYDSVWIHVGNGQRGTFEVFLALALLTATVPRQWKGLRYALGLFWIASAGYVFYGGFDAEFIRLTFLA